MTLEAFLTTFCAKLKAAEIRYAFLRGWEGLPTQLSGGDIDILIESGKRAMAEDILKEIEGVTITAETERFNVTNLHLWNLDHKDKNGDMRNALQLDLIDGLTFRGLTTLNSNKLLDNAIPSSKYDWLMILPEEAQLAVTLLNQGLVGKYFKPKDWQKLSTTTKHNRVGLRRRFEQAFDMQTASGLVNLIADGERQRAERYLPRLRRGFLWHKFTSTPWQSFLKNVSYFYREAKLAFFENDHITTVAFLGADGAGKSTAVFGAMEQLKGAAKRIELRHFRPKAVDPEVSKTRTMPDPHEKAERGKFASFLKLGWYALQYWKARLKPQRISNLIFYDRHFYDLLADPRRYRYGASLKVAWFVARYLVPQPDIILHIDADADVIQARKAEVSAEETARQVAAYRKLTAALPNGYTIDGTMSPKKVQTAVIEKIISAMC